VEKRIGINDSKTPFALGHAMAALAIHTMQKARLLVFLFESNLLKSSTVGLWWNPIVCGRRQ